MISRPCSKVMWPHFDRVVPVARGGLAVAWEPRSALVSVPGGRAERLGVLMSRMRGIIEA